jgi:hypothetical protein
MHTDASHGAGCFTRREPLAAYLDCANYVSSSALRRFARTGQSPESAMRTSVVPKEATLGDALHAILLEPERFDEDFYTGAHAALPAESPDAPAEQRTWLSETACKALAKMRDAVLGYDRLPLREWLERGEREISCYWTDEHGGRWKARPDCLCDDVIVELKTASDIRPNHFLKSRRRFGYDLQAAHYLDGVARLIGRQPRFLYVAVESVRPHGIWVHEPEPEALAAAMETLLGVRSRFQVELNAVATPA